MRYNNVMEKNSNEIEDKFLELIKKDQDEKVVCLIKKHPFGLFLIYFTGLFVAFSIISVAFVGGTLISRAEGSEQSNLAGTVLVVIGLLVTLLVLFFTYVSGFIYQHNVIIVTTEKIAQILYKNLVDRKISQLSIGEIQDVTVNQKGMRLVTC